MFETNAESPRWWPLPRLLRLSRHALLIGGLMLATGCAAPQPVEAAQKKAAGYAAANLFNLAPRGYQVVLLPKPDQEVIRAVKMTTTSGSAAGAVRSFAIRHQSQFPTGAAFAYTVHSELGPRGLVVTGSRGPDGKVEHHRYTEMPKRSVIGATWAEYLRDDRAGVRRCKVQATPFCSKGVAIHCVTQRPEYTEWGARHWCLGLGLVGYAAMSGERSPAAKLHTKSMVVDGRAVTQPEGFPAFPTLKTVQHSVADAPMRLAVGGLSFATSDADLREAFGKFGELVHAMVAMDGDSGRSRGFGFVTMLRRKDGVAAAKALDRTTFQGRVIRVNDALTPRR